MTIESKFARKVTTILKYNYLLNKPSDLESFINLLILKDKKNYDGELDIEGKYINYKKKHINDFNLYQYDNNKNNSSDTNFSSNENIVINTENYFSKKNDVTDNNIIQNYFSDNSCFYYNIEEKDIDEIIDDSINEIIDKELNIDWVIEELFLCFL